MSLDDPSEVGREIAETTSEKVAHGTIEPVNLHPHPPQGGLPSLVAAVDELKEEVVIVPACGGQGEKVKPTAFNMLEEPLPKGKCQSESLVFVVSWLSWMSA